MFKQRVCAVLQVFDGDYRLRGNDGGAVITMVLMGLRGNDDGAVMTMFFDSNLLELLASLD